MEYISFQSIFMFDSARCPTDIIGLPHFFNSNIMGIIWLHSELQTYSLHFSDKESENMRVNDLPKMMDLALWYIDDTDHTPN